jgi:hypothetical protein
MFEQAPGAASASVPQTRKARNRKLEVRPCNLKDPGLSNAAALSPVPALGFFLLLPRPAGQVVGQNLWPARTALAPGPFPGGRGGWHDRRMPA